MKIRLLLLLAILLTFAPHFAYGEPFYITITIDVEGTYGSSPYESMIIGKLPGWQEEFGVPMIMDICDKHGVKATFFVDVYEYRLLGEQKMSQLVRTIHDRGHDVQLHTHPAWAPSSIRPLVKESQYSYSVHRPAL